MLFYLTKSNLTQMNLAAIKGNHVNLDTETVVTLGTLEAGTLETLGTVKIVTITEILRLIKIKVVS